MTTSVLVLDRIALTAPFGVRFWDVASGAPESGDLAVMAFPDSYPELRTAATRSPGGVYSFSGLPGLRQAENGAGDDAFWSAPPAAVPYTMQVSDPLLRYLPFQFSATLPHRGLFAMLESPSLPSLTPGPDWLPLFSQPSRALPGPSGVIHAVLQDDILHAPASWALISAQAGALPPAWAVADERGVVSIFQAYPELIPSGFSSPLTAPNLTNQSWPVTVSIYYSAIRALKGWPDLDDILRQGAAFVWRDSAHTGLQNQFQLAFGTDLVCRSLDSVSGRELPVLLITSATSPL